MGRSDTTIAAQPARPVKPPRITGRRTRRTRVLRLLGAAQQSGLGPGGLSTSDIASLLDVDVTPRMRALTTVGGTLRACERDGLVARGGHTPGGWQNKPGQVWAITREGREWSDAHEAFVAGADASQAKREARRVAAGDAVAFVMVELGGRDASLAQRRRLAAWMRSQGCTLQVIGDTFGTSREQARLDLQPEGVRNAAARAARAAARSARGLMGLPPRV